MKTDNVTKITGLLVIAFIALFLGLAVGTLIKKDTEPLPEFEHWGDEPVNQLVVEMDKSCFEQFKNNTDKTIFVKLYFKE